MNCHRVYLLKYTIFILLVPFFLYTLENTIFRRNSLLLSGLTENSSKDIQSSFDEFEGSSLPTSPNDLLNILQRIEAMNNATAPSNAIDDALKAFERETIEESSFDLDYPVKNSIGD